MDPTSAHNTEFRDKIAHTLSIKSSKYISDDLKIKHEPDRAI